MEQLQTDQYDISANQFMDIVVPLGNTTHPTLKITDMTNERVLWKRKFVLDLSVKNGYLKNDIKNWGYYEDEYSLSVEASQPNMDFKEWSDGITDNPRSLILTKDIHLTAYCDVSYFTILYNTNYKGINKTAKVENVEKASKHKTLTNEELIRKEQWFKRDGYTIYAFNTKRDGSGVQYKVGEEMVVEGNTTLYAQWRMKGVILFEKSSNVFNDMFTFPEANTYGIYARSATGSGKVDIYVGDGGWYDDLNRPVYGGEGAVVSGYITVSNSQIENKQHIMITQCIDIVGNGISIKLTSGQPDGGSGGKVYSTTGIQKETLYKKNGKDGYKGDWTNGWTDPVSAPKGKPGYVKIWIP